VYVQLYVIHLFSPVLDLRVNLLRLRIHKS
jgi:hypothetical protein